MLAKMIDKIVSLKETKIFEIGPAIEKAAKAAETKTATTMAECIAGGIKDTLDELHRDPAGFFKGGAR